LLGWFNAYDTPKRSLEFDLAYVDDSRGLHDGVFGGLAAIQRLGHLNLTLRALGSQALDEASDVVSDGALLFAECSMTPAHSENVIYLNAFWGIDRFSSAARGPDREGPLGRTGILFAAVGLGAYAAPLSNVPDDAVGAALGYQMFLGGMRRQLIVELGGRTETESDAGHSDAAVGARYQQAMGRHTVLQLDGFAAARETGDDAYGGRLNLRYEF
jgi:hypothetical protein